MFNEDEIRFINRFLFHTRFVQNNMILLEKQSDKYDFLQAKNFAFINQAMFHDLDKINSDMIYNYVIMSTYYYLRNNNLPFDHIDVDKYKAQTERHYKTQRHHFYDNDIEPNIIDISETSSDIDAVSNELKEDNNINYFNNVLLNKPKVKKHEMVFRQIFKILENKNPEINITKKTIFIDKYINYIRKFQDYMITIAKKGLPFETDKWKLIRLALNYNLNDFSEKNIIYSGNIEDFFYYNKNKSQEYEGLPLLCSALACFGKDYKNYVKTSNYLYLKDILDL